MKTNLYTNCSLLRLQVKAGVMEYGLPQNVDWAKQTIDKMIVCAPSTAAIDPVDGATPIMTASDITDAYITLYDSDNREIMHDVALSNILHTNNAPIEVNAQLNLSLCKIAFTTAPSANATLLLYVFYGTRQEEYYEIPRKSITVEFPLNANEQMTFQEIINTYAHALSKRINGIICWNAANNPAWLTLRDYDLTYQMANVHTELCREDSKATNNAHVFWLNDIDIDFDYSNIREAAGQNSTQKITFFYN